jgi:hypothetical protein
MLVLYISVHKGKEYPEETLQTLHKHTEIN